MTPVSLPQCGDASQGTTATKSVATLSADFSTVLADADTKPTGELREPIRAQAMVPPPPLVAITLVTTPAMDPSQALLAPPPGSPNEAAVSRDDPPALAPSRTGTSASADSGAAEAPPPILLDFSVAASVRKLANGVTIAGRPTSGGRTLTDASDSAATEGQENKSQSPNTAVLTMQQALAVAASLVAPASAAPKPVREGLAASPLKPASGAAPATAALASSARAGSFEGASSTPAPVDSKPLEAGSPTVALPAHVIAMILDAQGIPTTHPQNPAAPAAASIALNTATASPAAAPTHGSDLHQLDALVRDIAELSGATGRAAMRLNAEQLGPLEIRLHRSDAGMSVSIRTESEQGHSTVVQAQQQLSDDMRANGLKVAATSVLLGHGGANADRHDRQPLRFAAPIETAAPEADQREADEQRPAGRYA